MLTLQVTIVCVLAGAAGGALILRRAGERPTNLASVFRALVAAGVVVVVSTFLRAVLRFITSRVEPLDLFGVAHVLYLSATVTVPMIGVAICAAALRERSNTAMAVLGAVMIVPALVGFYATHVAPFRLRVESVDVAVPTARAGSEPLRLAVLADLQTTGVGRFEQTAIDAVMELAPDVILVPGDIFHGSDAQLQNEIPRLQALLGQLHAPGGVYFVRGDVDPTDAVIDAAAGTGIRVLDNEVVSVGVRDRMLMIGGTMLEYSSEAANDVRTRLADAPVEWITVLVSHRPDAVFGLAENSDIDVTVAGHTHGGQIALPVIGPLATLSSVPRDIAAGGLGPVNGNLLYVSAGVGMERGQAPQVRFGVPPVIGVVEINER